MLIQKCQIKRILVKSFLVICSAWIIGWIVHRAYRWCFRTPATNNQNMFLTPDVNCEVKYQTYQLVIVKFILPSPIFVATILVFFCHALGPKMMVHLFPTRIVYWHLTCSNSNLHMEKFTLSKAMQNCWVGSSNTLPQKYTSNSIRNVISFSCFGKVFFCKRQVKLYVNVLGRHTSEKTLRNKATLTWL